MSATVADTLAWTALPDDLRAQYRRAIEDEIRDEIADEGDNWDDGYDTGRSEVRRQVRQEIEAIELALGESPARVDDARKIAAEILESLS